MYRKEIFISENFENGQVFSKMFLELLGTVQINSKFTLECVSLASTRLKNTILSFS